MRQQKNHIIATSNEVGHPDFFVTTTFNPSWLKIIRELLQNEKVEDRPDIRLRIFHIKLQEMMRSI